MNTSSPNRYTAHLYYHGRLEQQFSSDVFNRILSELHCLVNNLRSGSSGHIIDECEKKIIHTCAYQAFE